MTAPYALFAQELETAFAAAVAGDAWLKSGGTLAMATTGIRPAVRGRALVLAEAQLPALYWTIEDRGIDGFNVNLDLEFEARARHDPSSTARDTVSAVIGRACWLLKQWNGAAPGASGHTILVDPPTATEFTEDKGDMLTIVGIAQAHIAVFHYDPGSTS